MYLIYCNGHEPCCRTLPRPVAGPGSISRRGWCRAEMRERGMHRMISDVSSSSSFFHSILILYTGGFCSFSNSFQMIQWFNLIQLRKRIGTPPRLVFFLGRGGFGAYELSSEVRRAAEYKLNLFGDRVRAVQTSVDVAMVCFHVKGRWNLGKAAKHIETLDISF